MELKEKLMAYSKVSPSGCWEWLRAKDARGYGKCNIGGGKWDRAHRVSYKVFIGEIPDGLVVRHICDNTSCCNPEHLLVGTMADNMRDCVERGRRPSGGEHHMSKLTEEDVKFIRECSLTAKELSATLGIHRSTVYAIRGGKTWRGMEPRESNV